VRTQLRKIKGSKTCLGNPLGDLLDPLALHGVRPVLITFGRDKQTKIQTTSNNLSETGIGLIHDVELQVGRIGVLTMYRLHEDSVKIRAEVRWRQPFCGSWFASGWRFIVEECN